MVIVCLFAFTGEAESRSKSDKEVDSITTILHSELQEFFERENVPAVFSSQAEIVKCLTPWLILYGEVENLLDMKTRQKINDLLHFDQQSAESFDSESGRFRLYFYREGEHAVPEEDNDQSGVPDYVERAAEYADESWQHQVAELGFEDPVVIGPLSIEFRDIDSLTYGYTQPDGLTTRIVVHSNFEDFPPNDDPEGNQLGALKVTIAHELKHSIQYATNRWRGDAGEVDWMEMDATMMENIVYPQVNDYYNYIGGSAGIFGNPRRSTPVAYHHVTWSLFYAEHLGMLYWVETWQEIQDDHYIPMLDAMMQALPGISSGEEQMTFNQLFVRNHLWHATSGTRNIQGYGFSESVYYPDAFMEQVHHVVPEAFEDAGQIANLAGSYRMFHLGPGQIGQITILAEHNHNNLAIGLAAYRTDGSVEEWIVPPGENGFTQATSPFSAVDIDSFIVVLANADRTDQVTYTLKMSMMTIPEIVTLEPNFPNPLSHLSSNSQTTIAFSVPETEHVTISVYDVTGRKIATVFERQVDPGRYLIPFDAAGLASGVYVYHMQAGHVQKSRQMTFIR